jgi:hypothetical protein
MQGNKQRVLIAFLIGSGVADWQSYFAQTQCSAAKLGALTGYRRACVLQHGWWVRRNRFSTDHLG